MIYVYGKDNCSKCDTLQMTLKSREIDYTYLKLDEDFTREELMKIKPSHVREFPVMFDENGNYLAEVPQTVLDSSEPQKQSLNG